MAEKQGEHIETLERHIATAADLCAALNEDDVLRNHANLKRLIQETCDSITKSHDLIQRLKQDWGV